MFGEISSNVVVFRIGFSCPKMDNHFEKTLRRAVLESRVCWTATEEDEPVVPEG
jgi:hypothetical protein